MKYVWHYEITNAENMVKLVKLISDDDQDEMIFSNDDENEL